MIRPWTMRREQHAGAPSEKNSYNQPNIRFHILEAKCTSPYENWTPVLHISNNIAWTEHTSCNQLCYRLPSDDLGIAGRPCTLLPSDHLFLIAWLRLLLARWNDSIFCVRILFTWFCKCMIDTNVLVEYVCNNLCVDGPVSAPVNSLWRSLQPAIQHHQTVAWSAQHGPYLAGKMPSFKCRLVSTTLFSRINTDHANLGTCWTEEEKEHLTIWSCTNTPKAIKEYLTVLNFETDQKERECLTMQTLEHIKHRECLTMLNFGKH